MGPTPCTKGRTPCTKGRVRVVPRVASSSEAAAGGIKSTKTTIQQEAGNQHNHNAKKRRSVSSLARRNKRRRQVRHRCDRQMSHGTKEEPHAKKKRKSRLIFPDVLLEYHTSSSQTVADRKQHDNDEISNVFFELANADEVVYRGSLFSSSDKYDGDDARNSSYSLVFHQDLSACGKHTGGIVWETSYLLLQYLLQLRQQQQQQQRCAAVNDNEDRTPFLGRTLELGAGVGFLGQCLASELCCSSIVMTETADVLMNLNDNLRSNQSVLSTMREETFDAVISACQLDWTTYEQDTAASTTADHRQLLKPHSFDTLLGTDVIFAPHLVEPLLQTASFFAHVNTVWYLCVQIRCTKSHQLFLDMAASYGFDVHDVSQLAFAGSCAWGKDMDCFLFRITRLPSHHDEGTWQNPHGNDHGV